MAWSLNDKGGLIKWLNPFFQFENLTIGYDPRCFLFEQLKLDIKAGEFICLLGPNGAGKSTLLKTMLGILEPIKGQLQLCDRTLSDYPGIERAKLMSAALTDRVQPDHLSVFDMVLLGRFPYRKGFSKLSQEDRQIAEKALEQFNAQTLKNRRMDTLSDGERQRVLLARAIAQGPKLLLLDEPTSFLDYPQKVETFYLLKQWVRNNSRSILMSTHDLDLSMSLADRIIILEPHKSIVEGAPEDLVINGDLNRVFHSDLLTIDHESGRFKIHIEPHSSIQLKGDESSIEYSWTYKALQRSGYAITSDAHVTVELNSKNWKLITSTTSDTYHSIYSLIKAVNSI